MLYNGVSEATDDLSRALREADANIDAMTTKLREQVNNMADNRFTEPDCSGRNAISSTAESARTPISTGAMIGIVELAASLLAEVYRANLLRSKLEAQCEH